jgi:hypothetical protein
MTEILREGGRGTLLEKQVPRLRCARDDMNKAGPSASLRCARDDKNKKAGPSAPLRCARDDRSNSRRNRTIVYCAPDISINLTSSLFIFFRPSIGRYTMCPAS